MEFSTFVEDPRNILYPTESRAWQCRYPNDAEITGNEALISVSMFFSTREFGLSCFSFLLLCLDIADYASLYGPIRSLPTP